MAGLDLLPWQQLVLDRMLGERADGRWSAFEVGMLVARQNGKGAVLAARALAGLFLFDERLILWTAHEFKTAKESFRIVREMIERTPALLGRVQHRGVHPIGFRSSNEDTSIQLETGQRLRFMARSKSAGRGFTGDCVIFDEAQELPAETIEASMPTTLAVPNPQIIYAGTAPKPVDQSAHWESIRDRGREGGDPGLAWCEWSPDEDPDRVDLDDREAWAAGIPSLGLLISEESVEQQRRSMTDDGFARECLSVWHGSRGKAAISSTTWAALSDVDSSIHGPMALAIDMPPDQSTTSIGVAGRRRDGAWHVEVIDYGSGSAWVPERIVELRARWGKHLPVMLDASGPARMLLQPLETVKAEPHRMTMGQMSQACGSFYAAVVEGNLRHLDQLPLTVAVSGATWRPLGESRAWARRGAVDISPLVAVTLAMFGVDSAAAARKGGKVW